MAQSDIPVEREARPVERPGESVRNETPRLVAAARRFAAAKKTRVDLGRRVLAPLVLALVPFFWVADATHRAALTTLGRDQGIFQYIAWALARGEVDYRDIRDVNGPLIHLLHSVMLALGGANEHRFHILELWGTGIAFAIVGACLPGLVNRRRPHWIERAAWGAAAAVILGGQYHLYIYWNQAQRESFCDWFLLPSLALQVATPATSIRGARARIFAIAALSTITWFGKPSFVLFTVAQLAVVALDRETLLGVRGRIASFAFGAIGGAFIPVLYLLRYGDLAAFVRISLHDVPAVYRFIWAKSIPEILGDDGPLGVTATALTTAAVVAALVALRELPRRAIILAVGTACALASVLLQRKGFGYHFHPLTALTSASLLAIVVMLWERFRFAPRRKPLGRYLALGAAAALAFEVTANMRNSPHTRNVWILAGGETPERRQSEEYFNSFKTHDFFPWEMRQAAEYLAHKTSANARVQTYGMDPYLLFLAERRSATPYIYAYDLNADAALEGGWHNRPTDAQMDRIRQIRSEHERDMLTRLRSAPPEAFVFVDRSPLITYQDAWEDFRYCCSESATWVAAHYHPAQSFGEFHVWMRDDLPNTDVEPTLPGIR